MGDVLGLTIETVSRQLTKLKEAEMIALPDRRTVVIKDRQRLQNLAEAA
jgi:CRP/FNR family transcriptional regulator